MSFILDALRKSETERQQQTAPGLADAHYRPGKTGRNIWIPLLVVVLAANAAILAIVMNADSPESDPAVTNSDRPVESRNLADQAVRPLTREVTRKKETPAPVTTEDQSVPGVKESAAVQLYARNSEDPDSVQGRAIQEGLPSLQQLVATGQLSLQPLHLDIHVYADTRPKRFVFINMKKYREGEILDEGPAVEEITLTGVILDYRGNRFTLDRD